MRLVRSWKLISNHFSRGAIVILLNLFCGSCGDFENSLEEESTEGEGATEIGSEGSYSEEKQLGSDSKDVEEPITDESLKTGPFTVMDDIKSVEANILSDDTIRDRAWEAEKFLGKFSRNYQAFYSSTLNLVVTNEEKKRNIDSIFFDPTNLLEGESCHDAVSSLGRILGDSFHWDLTSLDSFIRLNNSGGSYKTSKVIEGRDYPRKVKINIETRGQSIENIFSGKGTNEVVEFLSTISGKAGLSPELDFETSEVTVEYHQDGISRFDEKISLYSSKIVTDIDYVAYGEISEVKREVRWSLQGDTNQVLVLNFFSKGIVGYREVEFDNNSEVKLRVSFPDDESMDWDLEIEREGQVIKARKEFRGKGDCALTTK